MTTFWTLGQTDTKHHFDSDKKVRFYTGMPSGEILMVVFEHVTKYITHRTQSLNGFQEFIILLIKLRLNVFFQYAFPKQVTLIIDCFEVFDRPTNLLARAQSFSNYMHHNTIKILIGITPQGTVCFVSQAWGGRTSDKYFTELWVFRTPSSW